MNDQIDPAHAAATAVVETGRQQGLYSCPACGRVSQRLGVETPDAKLDCPRCGTALHHRLPNSLERATAFTAAAMVLYAPANVLPVMSTISLTGTVEHTILGGIHELWLNGDWLLAVIVFVASIAVPIVKLLVMGLLIVTARRQSTWRSLERATLYRWVHAVGHWSMLDVFVVVLLVGMIHFGPFAGVRPHGGLLAFGAVVVLTIFGVASFDPRLLWPDTSDVARATGDTAAAPPLSATPPSHE